MNAIEESKVPETVYNHLNYINNDNDKIKFLELFFNIKLKWYQKLYLKMCLLNRNRKEFSKIIQFVRNMKGR